MHVSNYRDLHMRVTVEDKKVLENYSSWLVHGPAAECVFYTFQTHAVKDSIETSIMHAAVQLPTMIMNYFYC